MNCSIFQKFYLYELVKLLSLESWPEKTADILRCHHWFPWVVLLIVHALSEIYFNQSKELPRSGK